MMLENIGSRHAQASYAVYRCVAFGDSDSGCVDVECKNLGGSQLAGSNRQYPCSGTCVEKVPITGSGRDVDKQSKASRRGGMFSGAEGEIGGNIDGIGIRAAGRFDVDNPQTTAN